MSQHLVLKFLKGSVHGNVQVSAEDEMAIHANEHSGNAGGAGAHGFPKDRGRCHRLQFESMNLFGAPSMGKCRLSSCRAEVAHPVHDPVRGDEVAFLILDKNGDRGLNRLATFPSANGCRSDVLPIWMPRRTKDEFIVLLKRTKAVTREGFAIRYVLLFW